MKTVDDINFAIRYITYHFDSSEYSDEDRTMHIALEALN